MARLGHDHPAHRAHDPERQVRLDVHPDAGLDVQSNQTVLASWPDSALAFLVDPKRLHARLVAAVRDSVAYLGSTRKGCYPDVHPDADRGADHPSAIPLLRLDEVPDEVLGPAVLLAQLGLQPQRREQAVLLASLELRPQQPLAQQLWAS